MKSICFLTIFLLFFQLQPVHAQSDTAGPVRIAVLAPLYLDSAFEHDTYKLGSTNIPKYFLPGLEFYNGVMAAVDSLQKEFADIDVYIYDTKKKGQGAENLVKEMEPLGFDLILASFSNAMEQKMFSSFSLRDNIPLISPTYPNDAYVTGNPNFVMINSSLKTHIEGMYKHIQRYYPVGRFVYITRKGTLEDRVMNLFAEAGRKTLPIKYLTVQLQDDFTSEQVTSLLDSNSQNVIICGSLDENFGTTLIKTLNQTESYQIVAVGMPTWDGLKAVAGTDNQKLNILYSTPYKYPRKDKSIDALAIAYKSKFNGRPSDMFFKGYETMYSFTKKLCKYKNDFLNHLQDNSFNLTNSFNFMPVKLNSNSTVPDYIENKKLYFIDITQGTVKSVN